MSWMVSRSPVKKGKPEHAATATVESLHSPLLSCGQMSQCHDVQNIREDALAIVMGDTSGQSRQYAQHIEWAFESLLFAYVEGKGDLTEDVVRDLLPGETLRLAIDVGWIPYLDDNGDPLPEKTGGKDIHGYAFTEAFYAAFLQLLPIDSYIEDAKQTWVHPTPAEIVQEVLDELPWRKLRLIEQMQIESGTQYTLKRAIIDGRKTPTRILVLPQDSKERYGLDQIIQRPTRTRRRNTAQADYRNTLLKVIRKNSKKYAALEEEQLRWRHPR